MGLWSSIFGKGGASFLEGEAAKGLGDTEYMKQTKTVRHTFPGSAGTEDFEIVKQVSASNESTFDSRGGARPTASPASYQASSFGSSGFSAPTSTAASSDEDALPPAPEFQPRRDVKVNTDMDMFRNIAKKVGR